ncbi:hypothetical protein MMC28_002283 [Mycoblastus sanguinarius]|nr:hypothetical protein [Mycoblastus sanguinarius]
MPLFILFYLLASVAYIFFLPKFILSSSNTIAVQFGSVVFGLVGSLVLALIVSGSYIGALNTTTFTSGRLVYAAGKESFLPELLGHIGMPGSSQSHSRLQRGSWLSRTVTRLIGDEEGRIGFTLINAMLFNALLIAAYIVVGDFATLITFYGVAGYTFYFITVLGLIVLRNVDIYAHHLLLRELVPTEQGGLCEAGTDDGGGGFCSGGGASLFLEG